LHNFIDVFFHDQKSYPAMKKYIVQLLSDIVYATENISLPFIETELQLHDPIAIGWLSEEEEEETAPVRNLEEWTGISKEMLPPVEMLNDEQVSTTVAALKKMLDTCNWSFVLQTKVPERIQYASIRDNFNQQAKIKRWHMGFFELCRPGTAHGKCALGEYCQCAFYTELFSGFTDKEQSPEEERAMHLEIEIKHLQRKYGDDPGWMKYYPYHLDANYDDENGNPYNYGFEDEDEESDDNWWRRQS
jgi:hypothetical protein